MRALVVHDPGADTWRAALAVDCHCDLPCGCDDGVWAYESKCYPDESWARMQLMFLERYLYRAADEERWDHARPSWGEVAVSTEWEPEPVESSR